MIKPGENSLNLHFRGQHPRDVSAPGRDCSRVSPLNVTDRESVKVIGKSVGVARNYVAPSGQSAYGLRTLGDQIFPQLWLKTVLQLAGTLDGRCQCAVASIWL